MRNDLLRKSLVLEIMILFIVMSVVPATGMVMVEKSHLPIFDGKTLYVGGTGEGNYSSIQAAINDASDGDTVFVFDNSSPYYENVVVDKTINLIGEDKDTTVIDGNKSGDVVYVSANWVNISGFTIRNGGFDDGIEIRSNYSTITSNNINSNNWNGIDLGYSSSNTITGNNVNSNNDDGIRLCFSSSNTITGNTIRLSYYGDGIELYSSSNNTITDNIILNNRGGIDILVSCNNNNISGNIIRSNNDDGILLYFSSSNTITGNSITNNYGNGIYLRNSSGNSISSNNITLNNDEGICLHRYSCNNTIYHNNFINNAQNAYDECNNTWDDGKYGNYWDDYEERYPNARKLWWKGIWDTPYEIPAGDNKDMCPLIKQWTDVYPYNNNQVQSKNNVVKKTIIGQTSNQQLSSQQHSGLLNLLKQQNR